MSLPTLPPVVLFFRDPVTWLAMGLASLPLWVSLTFPASSVVAICQLSLAILASVTLLAQPPRFETPITSQAWSDLGWAVRLLAIEAIFLLLASNITSSVWIPALSESFRTGFYFFLIVAVDRTSSRRAGQTLAETSQGWLLRILLMVLGLFVYFIVLPRAVTPLSSAGGSLFLVLDLYLLTRVSWLLSRPLSQRPHQGSPTHPVLATALGLLTAADLSLFVFDTETSFLVFRLSKTVLLFAIGLLIVLARQRPKAHLSPERKIPKAIYIPPIGPGQITLLCAFGLPLIHLSGEVGSAANLLPPLCCKMPREVFLAIWLPLVGSLAIAQHQQFHRHLLAMGRQRTKAHNALRKSQTSLAIMAERQRNQRAIHEAELNFATIFRASPRGLVICSFPDMDILEANTHFSRLCEQPSGRLQGKNLSDIGLRPNHQDIQRLLQDDRLLAMERNLRLPSGEDLPIMLDLELLDLKLQPAILCVVRPAQPNVSLARIGSSATIPEDFSIAVVACTSGGLVFTWNQGAENLFGISRNDAMGTSIFPILDNSSDSIRWHRVDPDPESMPNRRFVILAMQTQSQP